MLATASCSFIEFERGPYAIRGLDVVYSAQEDLTFLSWRLRDDAILEDIEFELFDGGGFVPLDPGRAPYPAAPYPCDRNYVCFQYQVEGAFEYPDDVSPVRSVHRRHGVFPGSTPRRHTALRTFEVAPIGIERNTQVDPRRFDWFADNDIPLRRAYQWQLVARDERAGLRPEEACEQAAVTDRWAPMDGHVAMPQAWVEGARCFVARPVRSDGPGARVAVPFAPSAELVWEVQDYVPESERHPTLYAFLFDLQINNTGRCREIQDKLVSTIGAKLSERSGEAVQVGIYTPLAADTGEPTDGCSQRSQQDYPMATIVHDTKEAAVRFESRTSRALLIYVNNMELPPGERAQDQLREYARGLRSTSRLRHFHWFIGSNTLMDHAMWDFTTGWRPIEDKSFIADLQAFGNYHVPFRTMLHYPQTEVPIRIPEASSDPRFFKICDATPPLRQLRVSGRFYRDAIESRIHAWPHNDDIAYQVDLPLQELVPNARYQNQRVVVVVEVCERFCDNPFRSRAGNDYDNWRQTPGVCQWTL